MNTDKLMELERKWRKNAERERDYVRETLIECADELAAALRAEQAVGEEQRARDERNSCDCHPETCGCPEWRVVLDGKFFIGGNRETCKTVAAAMNTAFDLAARRALGAARQSEGVVVVPKRLVRFAANIADEWMVLFAEAPGLEKYERFTYGPAVEEARDSFAMLAAAPGGEGEG